MVEGVWRLSDNSRPELKGSKHFVFHLEPLLLEFAVWVVYSNRLFSNFLRHALPKRPEANQAQAAHRSSADPDSDPLTKMIVLIATIVIVTKNYPRERENFNLFLAALFAPMA